MSFSNQTTLVSATSKRLTFSIYGLPKFPVKQNMASVNPFWAVRTEDYQIIWTKKKAEFQYFIVSVVQFFVCKASHTSF